MNPSIGKAGKPEFSLKRILTRVLMILQQSQLIHNSLRINILQWGGVKIGRKCFIGNSVTLDGIHPEWVEIGNHVHVTAGTRILTHFYQPDTNTHDFGKVTIGDHSFIGLNTLIVNRVEIGEGAVIAAGSVVTKDIPEWEIWGGNPAKFIRKRSNPFIRTKSNHESSTINH